MNNFYCYNPTKIIFGRGMIANITREIPTDAKVLIISGGGSAEKTGALPEVRQALKNYTVTEFKGVGANPEYNTCNDILETIKKNGSNYLLAVGGGSVIDATKYIALAHYYDGDAWDFMTGKAPAPGQALPFGCVQTYPATGSEWNNAFVISRNSNNEKLGLVSYHVFPRFSVLDPTLTRTLSKKQTAHGLADMFTHVLEQYLTYPTGGAVQDRQAEALLLSVVDLAEDLVNNLGDIDLRSRSMWIASQAVNGIINRGVPADWSTHEIGHQLTALYGLTHAETLTLILGGVWRKQFESKKLKLAQYGRRVWRLEGDDSTVAGNSIEKTDEFFSKLGLPTRLADVDLKADDVATSVCSLLSRRPKLALGENKDIGVEDVREIILSRA